jgi:hypothetical protein
MRFNLRVSGIAMLAALTAMASVQTTDGLAQGGYSAPIAPAPKVIAPSVSPSLLLDKPLAAPSLPPPVLESRPGGCPEGPPCPAQSAAPYVPAVRPGGCPEGDPCPNKQ